MQERDIPEKRWDGTFISAGVVEDSSGKLTSTNLLGNMYVPICRLTALAGSMIRGLIWALGENELMPSRSDKSSDWTWNHMIFGMGPTLRGFNEQLSKLRGTIFLLVTGYFGLSSRMNENGSVVVTRYLSDGKLSRHRATEPDTMIVFEGTVDRTVEVLPLKTEAAFYCVFAVGTYHKTVPEDISSQLKG